MNYLISEEDIKTILVQGWDFRRLIKSKQPVEKLAEGIIRLTNIGEVYIDFGKGFGKDYLDNLFCKYGPKPIKIYIEVVK